MTKGVTLQTGQAVVLSLDGTLVYVEDVQPMWASVVALPEQPAERTGEGVFTAGAVAPKKISPFSQPDRVVPADQLSDKNREFIAGFQQWRVDHGPRYKWGVVEPPVEEAAPKRDRKRKGKDSPRYLRRCTVCNEQPAHPNHEVHNGGHEFVDPDAGGAEASGTGPDAAPEPAAALARRRRRATRPPKPEPLCAACDAPESSHTRTIEQGGHRFIRARVRKAREERVPGARFRVLDTDLTKVLASTHRLKPGNRFRRVYEVLVRLPDATGTVDDMAKGLANDGLETVARPRNVVRRAMRFLKAAGNVEQA